MALNASDFITGYAMGTIISQNRQSRNPAPSIANAKVQNRPKTAREILAEVQLREQMQQEQAMQDYFNDDLYT